jgi:uncharacterized membrane protein YeaQ/YmgE (transglycosylase-associated protein family)
MIVVVLLALNSAIVIWRRRKRGEKPPDLMREKVGLSEAATTGLLVVALLIGYAARTVTPGNPLSLWIAEHGLLTYFALCVIGAIFLQVVLSFLTRRRRKRDGAA